MKVLNTMDRQKIKKKTYRIFVKALECYYKIFNNNQASLVNFIIKRFKGSLLESQLKLNKNEKKKRKKKKKRNRNRKEKNKIDKNIKLKIILIRFLMLA